MIAEVKKENSPENQEASKKRHLYISGRIWHELYPKVNPGHFLRVLRRQIDLPTYGQGVDKFYFTFVVMERITPNFASWVGSDYYPKKASMDIGIRLPYQEVVEGTKEEVVRMMEQAFLSGIDTIGEFELVAPFDHQAFKQDVEAIFSDLDWWVEA